MSERVTLTEQEIKMLEDLGGSLDGVEVILLERGQAD